MEDVIKRIIEAGVLAPSGENCQPWEFVIHGEEVELWNVPGRDNSLYSWGQRASLVAHGAFIENAMIAASYLGYEATVALFPDHAQENLVARLSFKKGLAKDEPLYSFIPLRATNRRPYATEPLTPDKIQRLIGLAQNGARLRLFTERSQIELFASAASVNERILFQNERLHSFFFGHLLWNEAENRDKSIGLYIKTLELPPPAVPLFKLASNWSLLRLLNVIGFASFIANANAKIYASSAAFGAIIVPTVSNQDFVAAGRLMERIWLTAVRMGLSIQPLTGVLFLMLRIRAKDDKELSDNQKVLIERAYRIIESECEASGGVVAMLFRLGRGDSPTARSSRFAVERFIRR